MRTCREIRRDAWNIMVKGKWGWRFLLASVVLYAVFFAVLVVVGEIYAFYEVQTWESFRAAQLEAKRAGFDLSVPSFHEELRMTLASGFAFFVAMLGNSIIAFGTASVLLRGVKGETEGWFACAFDGFKRPLGLLWLVTLITLKILLWMLPGIVVCSVLSCRGLLPLLLVPGFIAVLRYALAWFVKAENPEMDANACIKRSCVLMRGRKWRFFIFLLSYIGWFFLGLVLPAVGGGISGALGAVAAAGPLALVMSFVFAATVMYFVFVGIYLAFGGAVFYRDAKAEVDGTAGAHEAEETVSNDG